MVQRDRKFTSAKNEDQLEADSIRIDQSGVRNENKAFINSPNAAYIKKFEKFFNFLQNTIKKISKAVKENSEKQAEDLKGPLRGINITKHWSQIANNTSNTEANETKKIANVPENSISTLTTTTELKIQRDLDDAIYERTRNEKDFVVHTPIDSSKYKITAAKKFSGLFDAPFLQFDEKETGKKVKIINYQSNGSLDKRNFHNAVEKEQKPMDEDGCILNNQADSSDSDDSSEYSVKQLKCNIQAQTSNETNSTASLQKIKRAKLSPETNEESRNQKKQDKPSNITGSLEYEIIPVSHKVSVDDEAVKVILESEDDEEFNEDTSTKHINSNQSEHEFTNKHDKFTFQPLHSQLTENHEKQIHNGPDFTGFEKTTAKTKRKNYHQETTPKIPVTLPSSPKTSTSATTNPNFSTQTTIMQSNSKTAVGVESDKINQTFIELSTMAHPATDLKDNKDTHESSVENTGTVKDFAEFIPNMERNGKSEAGEQHIEEVRLLQQKRKKCSHHRHGSQRKCPNMDNISAEDTAAKINTTQVLSFLGTF
ncbi:EF hand family protein [Wuchereria bancrofti]|uniref:EF hand family protein n=1 Tax=Wuchereria bancrofti TaxID=6293 RepID=J9EIW7_WUCBA|nr:EF hand family protein [Wuchereria bancrofti]